MSYSSTLKMEAICSFEERNLHEAGSKRSLFTACFMLVFGLSYSSTLRMEAICSFEARTQDETGRKRSSVSCLLRTGFSLGLLIDHEDGGGMFLRNVS
jgi:hypothetical protein